MLIGFKVENFLSLRDEQLLSMVASSDESRPENLIEVEAIAPVRLLRSAAIYGANASGKTNLLKALAFMRWMVVFSQTQLESKDSLIDVAPFALDPKWSEKPSRFEIRFVQNGVQAIYSFSVIKERVTNEWLVSYPQGRPRQLFVRTAGESDKPKIEFGGSLRGTKKHQLIVSETTRQNSLVLSSAAQANFGELSIFYEWFSKNLITAFPEERDINIATLKDRLAEDVDLKGKVLSLLSFADSGIVDLKTRATDIPEGMLNILKKHLNPEAFELIKERTLQIKEIALVHKIGENRTVALDFDVESRGTHNLLALLNPILLGLESGGVLCIDEFTASLHPHVGRRVIEFIHSRRARGKPLQLIFVSHDTNLLDASLFRRDQIWLTEKDSSGATQIYPLSDFHPRKGENIARGYLQGRYGAVPLAGFPEFDDAAETTLSMDSSW